MSKKAITLVNKMWEYLENNYKGSEITFDLICDYICKNSDTARCEKQALEYAFSNYEFYDIDYYNYCVIYLKENYGIKLK